MQGKEDDKVEGFLNVKDLRRQTTANEEKLVISASANGNNQSGNSSTPECSSLICNEAEGVVNFPGDNQETLYFQSYIFDDSASHFYKQVFKFVSGKHDCRTSRSKTTEAVAEQSQKIKMYIKTTNFDHKLSLQERIQSLCIFLCSQS